MASPNSPDDIEVHSTSELSGEQELDRPSEFSRILSSILQFGPSKYETLNYVPSISDSDAFAATDNPCCSSSNTSPSFNNSLSNPSFAPMMVRLEDNEDLWSQFSQEGTEMIIAKTGRLMFPTLKLKFENLCPYTYYKVFLEFAPVDFMRYKFERDTWVPKLTEKMKPPEWLLHPLSPALGVKWMEKPLDFNVKLTNCLDNCNEGMACLSSNHKYMMKIHVIEGSDATQRDPLLTRTFPLDKTTFMAVTTYQNPKIKDLKTEKNIHAKGIRHKKMKFCQVDPGDTKENNAGCFKRPRFDVPLNHNSQFLVSRNESITQPESFHGRREPTSSSECPSSSADTFSCCRTDDKNDLRSLPPVAPYNTLASYPYSIPPAFDLRIPFSAPLSVHCPRPHYLENAHFLNPYSTVPRQAFLFHPSLQPSSVAFHNWYANSCPRFSCSSSSCNVPALRVCPGYRVNVPSFQPCISLGSSDNVPSSTSEMEQPSTSSEGSCLPTSSDIPLPRQIERESQPCYRHDFMDMFASSKSVMDSLPKTAEHGSSAVDMDKLSNTVTENGYSVCVQN